MPLSSSPAIFEIQALKLQTSMPCSQAKPASPECCVFAETSTMAPFTALLTLELQAPLGSQKLRREMKRLSVRRTPETVNIKNIRTLLPGETCQHRMLCLC